MKINAKIAGVLLLAACCATSSTCQVKSSDSLQIISGKQEAAIVVGAIAIIAAITVGAVLIYKSNGKKTVTGCVASSDRGMTLTGDEDRRVFVLAGTTQGLKPGERMKLKLKKVKGAGKSVEWQPIKVSNDFGACPA
jgi:hypothetical protein